MRKSILKRQRGGITTTDNKTRSFNRSYSPDTFIDITRQGTRNGMSGEDINNALSIFMQETGIGQTQDPNVYAHFNPQYYKGSTGDVDAGLKSVKKQLQYARDLQNKGTIPSGDEFLYQGYNGYGKIKKGHSDLEGATKMYGVTIPKEGIDFKKTPLYGERIKYIKNNVIKSNPQIQKIVKENSYNWSEVPNTIPLSTGGYQQGGIVDPRGQWAHPGKVTTIPGNDITMEGVNYPVLGVSDTGHTQMMQPGGNYKFNGNSVTEYPQMQFGGNLEVFKTTWHIVPQMQIGGFQSDNTKVDKVFIDNTKGYQNPVPFNKRQQIEQSSGRIDRGPISEEDLLLLPQLGKSIYDLATYNPIKAGKIYNSTLKQWKNPIYQYLDDAKEFKYLNNNNIKSYAFENKDWYKKNGGQINWEIID